MQNPALPPAEKSFLIPGWPRCVGPSFEDFPNTVLLFELGCRRQTSSVVVGRRWSSSVVVGRRRSSSVVVGHGRGPQVRLTASEMFQFEKD